MKRVTLLLLTFFIATGAFAEDPVAFVWADQPTLSSYTPHAGYTYSPLGGAVTIKRLGAGTYTVIFAGLGKVVSQGLKSNAQVTAYGSRTICNVESWSGSPDLSLNVRCYSIPDGSLRDTQVTALFTFAL